MTPETSTEEIRAACHPVSEWANGPGDTYSTHAHSYKKVLCCLEGSIVFHLTDGDVPLSAGDRLVLEPGVVHAATVGPSGVRCAEAYVS